MLLSFGFCATIVSLLVKGRLGAACLAVIAWLLCGGMLASAMILVRGPTLQFDLAHPPERGEVPTWLTEAPTKMGHRIALAAIAGTCELPTGEHTATFDAAGNLRRLEIESAHRDQASAVKAADEFAKAMGLTKPLRNTQLDLLEGTSFVAQGWNVQVQLWNVMPRTTRATGDGAGLRLTFSR